MHKHVWKEAHRGLHTIVYACKCKQTKTLDKQRRPQKYTPFNLGG